MDLTLNFRTGQSFNVKYWQTDENRISIDLDQHRSISIDLSDELSPRYEIWSKTYNPMVNDFELDCICSSGILAD